MLREGDAGDATERVLVDPERFAAGGVPHAINWYQPSWDGRTLAVGISAAGSEDASMHLIDVASGRALLEMSTYHQIRDGTAYPAVMLVHGMNDPRVDIWHSVKAAARLQRSSSSGKPVFMRIDMQTGQLGAKPRGGHDGPAQPAASQALICCCTRGSESPVRGSHSTSSGGGGSPKATGESSRMM